MQNEDKIIEKYKKFSYNFFWNNSVLLGTLCFFFGLTPFYELADRMICDSNFPHQKWDAHLEKSIL